MTLIKKSLGVGSYQLDPGDDIMTTRKPFTMTPRVCVRARCGRRLRANVPISCPEREVCELMEEFSSVITTGIIFTFQIVTPGARDAGTNSHLSIQITRRSS